MNDKQRFEEILGDIIRPNKEGEFVILCPLHDDNKPSFSGNVQKGVWVCHAGCGEGTIEDLARLMDKGGLIQKEEEGANERSKILGTAVKFYCDILKNSDPKNPAKDYLRAKGIKPDMWEKNSLGYAPKVRNLLKKHLLKSGFSTKQGIEAGVLTEIGSGAVDTFKDSVIFPICKNGRVVHISARNVGNNKGPKFKNLRGEIDFLFNEDALKNSKEVVICEGIPDTLTLLQHGINAVGVLGAGSFKKGYEQRFAMCDRAYLSFDGDDAGRKGNFSMAQLMPTKSVVVDLPEGLDVSDFVQQRGIKEYRQLMAEAKKLPNVLLEKIPSKTPIVDLPAKIQPIIEFIARHYTEAEAGLFLQHTVKARFNLVAKDIEHLQKNLKEASAKVKSAGVQDTVITKEDLIKSLKDEKDLDSIHPVQDYKDGTMNYAIKSKNIPCLITSGRELIPFHEAVLSKYRFKQKDIDTWRFSSAAAADFLDGKFSVDATDVFNRMKKYISRFIYLSDEALLDYLALWTMLTYVHMIFRYCPYVWVTAEKGSGKTLLMEVLREIVFNGELLTNPTEAVVFRDVEYNKITMLLDEVEQLQKEDRDTHGAVMRVLNGGFNKSGKVKRVEKNSKGELKVVEFSAYGPKMFAGISKINEVLRDRTVRISLYRKLKEEKTERFKQTSKIEAEQKKLRDDLYVFGLTHAIRISACYESGYLPHGFEHLQNRELDIWEPILVIADLLDQKTKNEILPRLIEFSKKSFEEKQEDIAEQNDSFKVLAVLQEMRTSKAVSPLKKMAEQKEIFRAESVFNFFQNHPDFEWMQKTNALTVRLRRVEVKSAQHRIEVTSKATGQVSKKRERVYTVDWKKIDELCERFEMPYKS